MTNEHTILDRAVKALAENAIPKGPSEDLVRQTLEQIENQQTTIPFVERSITMKSISKFVAAAIVIVGISALFLFNSGPGSIALADVYARVQQAQAFMYKMSMTMNGTFMEGTPPQNMESEGAVTISTEYGVKMENTIHLVDQDKTMTQQMYFLPIEKKMIQVMPSEKAYVTMAFSEDMLEKVKEQNNDPRDMLKKMMESECANLGYSEIDGVKVQGFQTTDPAYTGGMFDNVNATIWVDVKTWLPVRSEFSMTMGDAKMDMVAYDYIWNAVVHAEDFEPVIPEDYKSMGNIEMPKMDENAAINGLRFYAEMTDSYPEKIDLMNLMSSIGKMKDSQTEAAIEFKKQIKAAANEEEKAQMAIKQMAPLQSLGMFYATLMQEKKDPMYYGNRVTPADTDAVLMRWKLDNGKYKVIFGDLSSVEMEYNDLVKIEPQPVSEPQPIQEEPTAP